MKPDYENQSLIVVDTFISSTILFASQDNVFVKGKKNQVEFQHFLWPQYYSDHFCLSGEKIYIFEDKMWKLFLVLISWNVCETPEFSYSSFEYVLNSQ